MNILLLGSGGREHALAWKMQQSHHCNMLYIAPGNAGTALIGDNVPININDFEAQKKFCLEFNIDLVVVGPEEPLVNGVFDFYKKDSSLQHIIVVGPSKKAAQLEGSKAFSKQFMQRHKIPTAKYAEFTLETIDEGRSYILKHTLPIVLKADGLAAGKGVVICETPEHAIATLEDMLIHKQFGEASNKVVVEQFLQGIELSVFVLTNGIDYKIIGHAKDYKRVGEGDTGLNTGGMGCVSPVPFADDFFIQKVEEKIIKPTISGLEKEQLEYNGFIFFGLMNNNGEPYVIEYNCRLGDPETEVILPRLETDLVSLFAALDNHTLSDANIEYHDGYFATIMAVSGGYPGNYKKGLPINHKDNVLSNKNLLIFHAGTKQDSEGNILTNGGRVLSVTAQANSIPDAVNNAKTILHHISFDGMYFRNDIGYEFK
jgi:phosphoribosylamine--glycine ligase